MADPFLGEIRIFTGNFAPVGWAMCNGQIMSISQNTALFSLLGTFYGGNGTTNFALPNLQSSFPIHAGNSEGQGLSPYSLGEPGGAESVTLTPAQLATHTHLPAIGGGTPALPNEASPANEFFAPSGAHQFGTGAATTMAAGLVTGVGGGGAHDNMMPFLALNFIIALQGIFPARS